MAICEDELVSFVKNLFDKEFKAGSIEETLTNPKCFHLTFDDGFKEHLEVAKKLHKQFGIARNTMTFSINVGNSIDAIYTGMDTVYNALTTMPELTLQQYFQQEAVITSSQKWIEVMKAKILAMSPNQLKQLQHELKFAKDNLAVLFFNATEIEQLAKFGNIASHGLTHRDLTNHLEISKEEIHHSKRKLEQVTGREVHVFCYPEGKNNSAVQQYCREAGYDYGLSITHQPNNPYCIGRFCIMNHQTALTRRLDE